MKSMKSLAILAAVIVIIAVAFLVRAKRKTEENRVAEISNNAAEVSNDDIASAMPTFIELGSDRCTSCRAMIPVLDELRADHACGLNVRFIDVWDNPAEGERFSIKTIPTQILLSPDGKELSRHRGFWSADAIKTAFASNGQTLQNCDP